jgi:GNAT superfamily N-acetyltransferase
MKIKEYDEVDSWEVLHLNLMCLGYALTPERVSLIRMLDRRPFPFLAIYAVEGGTVCGQVGVFRLPMVTREGREDVGGIWAVCTHPSFSRHGIALQLLEEAHARMREAGLRFSTLGTERHLVAHGLYRKHGYEDVVYSMSAFSYMEGIECDKDLRAEKAGPDRLALADRLFVQGATHRLGFAWRHQPFFPSMVKLGDLNIDDIFMLLRNEETVGYAIAQLKDTVLRVSDVLLLHEDDLPGAISVLRKETGASYVRVRVNRNSDALLLERNGFRIASRDWDTFMMKSLTEHDVKDACALFGIGSERFLISWLDTT